MKTTLLLSFFALLTASALAWAGRPSRHCPPPPSLSITYYSLLGAELSAAGDLLWYDGATGEMVLSRRLDGVWSEVARFAPADFVNASARGFEP